MYGLFHFITIIIMEDIEKQNLDDDRFPTNYFND